MKKQQQKIQIILIFVGLFLIIGTYFYYPYVNKTKLTENQTKQKDLDNTPDNNLSTSFENVEYKGLYDLNKPFVVKAEKAHMLTGNPDIMYMTDMHVILYLSDGRTVDITSNKGSYNKVTYDCFFENNVKATDGETKIFAENLDLLATKNTAEIYNNVRLNYPTGSLRSDKVNYNFTTKFFKVSMFEGEDKVVKMKVVQ